MYRLLLQPSSKTQQGGKAAKDGFRPPTIGRLTSAFDSDVCVITAGCFCVVQYSRHSVYNSLITGISAEYHRTESGAPLILLLLDQSDRILHPWIYSEHAFVSSRQQVRPQSQKAHFFIRLKNVTQWPLGSHRWEAAEKYITCWCCSFICFEWEHGWDTTNLWCS